jgi:hypothetical protein
MGIQEYVRRLKQLSQKSARHDPKDPVTRDTGSIKLILNEPVLCPSPAMIFHMKIDTTTVH